MSVIDWDAWDECNRIRPHADDTDACACMPDFSKMDRTRQAKWDKLNLRTVSTKLRKQDYEQLQDYCIRTGMTPYRLLRRLLEVYALGYRRKGET